MEEATPPRAEGLKGKREEEEGRGQERRGEGRRGEGRGGGRRGERTAVPSPYPSACYQSLVHDAAASVVWGMGGIDARIKFDIMSMNIYILCCMSFCEHVNCMCG